MTRWILALMISTTAACQSPSTPAPQRTEAQPVAAHATPAAPPTTAPAALPNGLVLVRERSQVCMVNDQHMGREQIPVSVGEKVYYGCCPMCKGRLEQDASTRQAKDPVTGNPVDKATAVIARAPSGNVLYFESERTLAQYRL